MSDFPSLPNALELLKWRCSGRHRVDLTMTRFGEAFQGLGPVDGHCLSSVLLSQAFAVDWLTSTDLMIVFCNSGRLLAGDQSMVLLAEGSC